MSGAAAAKALEARFEGITKSELARLRKKFGRLDSDQHAQIAAITTQVVRAIALQPTLVLAAEEEPALVRAIVDLFDVSPDRGLGAP